MTRLTQTLIWLVVVAFGMFFVLEALLWMQPMVYTLLLPVFQIPGDVSFEVQALVLKKLFVNQGFYNLFIACAGVVGMSAYKRGNTQTGLTLIGFMCAASIGAGLVLAYTTIAYPLAFGQIAPALAVLVILGKDIKKAIFG